MAIAQRIDSKPRTSRAGVSIVVTGGGSTSARRLAIECRSIGRRAAHADVWHLECRSCSEWKINRANEEGAVNPRAARRRSRGLAALLLPSPLSLSLALPRSPLPPPPSWNHCPRDSRIRSNHAGRGDRRPPKYVICG